MLAEIFLGVLAVLLGRWYLQWRRTMNMLGKIPGPPESFLLGHVMYIGRDEEEAFKNFQMFTKYGDGIIRMRLLIAPYVLVYRAKSMEALLAHNNVLFKSREYKFIKPFLGEGLVTSEGEKWKSRRRLLTPAFHFKILDDFNDIYNKQSQILASKLDAVAESGKRVKIRDFLGLAVLDTIMETSMGWELNSQMDENSEYVSAAKKWAELMVFRGPRPWLHSDFIYNFLGYGKIEKQALKIMHGQSEAAIRRRKLAYSQMKKEEKNSVDPNNNAEIPGMKTKKRRAFLDLMLEEMAASNVVMTDEDLREEVDTFMFAGHDTTSVSTSFTLHFMATHPEIQQRLYEEIMDVVPPDGNVTAAHLKELRYLDACIKESLRKAAPVPIVGRESNKDIVIDGYTVPAGTTFLMNIYSLHRDTKYFPDPETYDPERFMQEHKRHAYAYSPFSAGARNCIGQRFAVLLQKVIICHILRRFTVHTHQTYDQLGLVLQVTLMATKGVWLTFKRRE